MGRKPGETLFLVAVLAAVAGLCVVLLPPGLSSDEEAVQYVQMKNFALHGSFEIHAPALGLGFEAAHLGGSRRLLEIRDGSLHAAPPPLFPWVVSLLYRIVGERAVDLAPILFLFFAALVLGLTLMRLMGRDALYWILLAGFLAGSPVFLQGLRFSGMPLALFLIVAALGIAVGHFGGRPSGGRLFAAALLTGAAALARPECLFVAVSFYLGASITLSAHRRVGDLKAVLAGAALALSAFVLHEVILHGRFPGPYLQRMMPFYALSPLRVAALAGAAASSFALLLLSRKEGISPLRKASLFTLSVFLAVGAVLLTAARISVAHLMAFFPAALFVFCGIPERLERLKKGEGILEAVLAATVTVSLVLGAAILRPGAWIVFSVWLPLVPFVILLLALERKVIFAAGGMYVVLAFFFGVALVNGVQESRERILKYRDYNAARIAFLEKHTAPGDALLFEGASSMEHAGPLFFDRVFLVARCPADRERLARQLRDRGVDGIHVWTIDPLGFKGFNPYGAESPPAFPFPPGSKSCCGGSCRERNYYLVRLNAAEAGDGRGGS